MAMKKIFLILFIFPRMVNASAEKIASLIPDPPAAHRSDLVSKAQNSGAVGDYFKLLLSEKNLKEGHVDEAFRLVSRVQEPLFAFWKNTVLAHVYLTMGKPHEAETVLKSLPPKPLAERVFGEEVYVNLYKRASISRYFAKKMMGSDFRAEAAEALSLFPADDKIKMIVDADNNIALSAAQKMERTHNLHLLGRHKDIATAITVAEILSTTRSLPEKCQALYELANGQRVGSNTGASIETFKEVVRQNCPAEVLPKALYWLGNLLPLNAAAAQDVRRSSLTRLFKEFPDHQLADDALLKLYRLAKDEGKPRDAKDYEEKLMALKIGDMKSTLAFEQAFPMFLAGKYREAAHSFARALDTQATADETHTRVLYWYARALEKTPNKKDQKLAVETYKKLVGEFPLSFYALFAAERLGEDVSYPRQDKPTTLTPPADEGDDFAIARRFIKAKVFDGARTVLDFSLQRRPDVQKTDAEMVVSLFLDAQNYRKALDVATKTIGNGLNGEPSAKNPVFWAALYPMAFADETRAGYALTGLPLGAIEGIMREESLFDTQAKSVAGALGLMQLMPGTAALVKKQLSQNITDYYDPQGNIFLGATYLKDMCAYFDNRADTGVRPYISLALAIMAYNAGPGNVNKWLKNFRGEELDVFIETIPLRETRDYVKRVLRSMHVYGRLYDETFFKQARYLD